MRKILLIFFLVITMAVTSSASFQPVEVQIETNYTDIISTEDSSTVVPYRITNPSSSTKDLKITIHGTTNSKFVDGSDVKDILLDKGTRTFLVEVSSDSHGEKELRLEAENLEYDVSTTVSKNVFVQESTDDYERKNVPGIGTIQLVSLLMISTLAYFALL